MERVISLNFVNHLDKLGAEGQSIKNSLQVI